MIKLYFFISSAILLYMHSVCEGLECYHCYSSNQFQDESGDFVPCNESNMTLSNTWTCPSPNARCIYEVVEVQSLKEKQIWRTCSNGISDPCDPNTLPPGIKMVRCTHCGTDRCNLEWRENERTNNTFTFNINANINLYIRQ